jgi:hypothetical protein
MTWNTNPIHQNKDGTWWFWDECWCNEYGPYETREECALALSEYVDTVL